MQCPKCGGKHIRKNGHRRSKQNHICIVSKTYMTRVEGENTKLTPS